ncbi:DUF916 domain-containing protein (plasmid) [Lactococcus garvieae]|uniref:DUF916 domain-containing protein n=1 Tax=Lactococcus garvieae TaxID=1363 RepID=UPI0030CCCF62
MGFILLLVALLFSEAIKVAAKDTSQTQGGYSVSPVPSEHQTKGIQDYYDIEWTPASKDEFGVTINNKSGKEQTYIIQINKARTNRNGIVDYSNRTPELPEAKYKLTEMVQIPKEVTIPSKSSKTVTGRISFPDPSFNGILMAGLHISEKKDKDESKAVSNTVAYNIPLVVRGDEDTRPKAELELTKVSVEKYSSKQSSLDVLLFNKKTNLLKESEFHAEIKDKEGKKITETSSKLDLTPETSFVYPVKLPDNMKAGEYSLILTVSHGKDFWEFKKDFKVSKSESKAITERSGQTPIPWLLYGLAVLVGVLIVMFLFFWIYRRRRFKEE